LPVAAARPIVLTASERHRLKKAAWGHKTPYQVRKRAQVVVHAARGRSNARTARETGLHVNTVRRWRGRFAAQGMSGLADRDTHGGFFVGGVVAGTAGLGLWRPVGGRLQWAAVCGPGGS
jgi:hypothetical protein